MICPAHSRIGLLLPLLALLLTAVAVRGEGGEQAGSLSDLQGLRTSRSRLPIYDDDQLRYHIFSREITREGVRLISLGTIIDMIRPGVRIDNVKFDEKQQPYALTADLETMLNFWKRRNFCDGVIFTDRSEIDQDSRIAAGDRPVWVRSPLFDLDGVGFHADFNRKKVTVRSQVRIAIRKPELDPRVIAKNGVKPPKYDLVRAVGDTLSIDQLKNEIVLSGHVTVDEAENRVVCDKLTIFLNDKNGGRTAVAGAPGKNADDTYGISGVREIRCAGNVRIERKVTAAEKAAHGEQFAEAELVVYRIPKAEITMTGTTDRLPVIRRGADSMSARKIVIFRDREEIRLFDSCRIVFRQPDGDGKAPPSSIRSDKMIFELKRNQGMFEGNVQVDDHRMLLACGRMDVRFQAAADGKNATAVNRPAGVGLGDLDFTGGGKRELRDVICSGGVRMTRPRRIAGQEERAEAARAELDYRSKVVVLKGGSPRLVRGGDTLSGRELKIWIEEERLQSSADSRIVLCAATTGGPSVAGRKPKETVITSDSSDLAYRGNRLTFKGNVKVRDPRLALDCDLLEIFLADAPDAPKTSEASKTPKKTVSATDPTGGLGNDGSKILRQVVCTGRVVAEDPRAVLKTDVLTLDFRPVPKGKLATPGLFQSNGTELTKIICAGNLDVVTKEGAGKKSQAAAAKPKPVDDGGFNLMGMAAAGPRGKMTLKAKNGQIDMLKNLLECHGGVRITEPEVTLDCEDLYVHTRDLTPLEAAKAMAASGVSAVRRETSIDDDPNAPDTARIPDRLLIGGTKELVKTVADKNVRIVRKTPDGKTQVATGDRAVYTVRDKKMLLTGKPAKMTDPSATMLGEEVLYDPETGQAWVTKNTFVIPTAR